MSLQTTIQSTGVSLLGISMPFLFPKWITGVVASDLVYTETDLSLELSSSSNKWRAPFFGVGFRIGTPTGSDEDQPIKMFKSLLTTSGTFIKEGATDSLLLEMHPQAYLRLSRLYKELLEIAPSATDNPLITKARTFGYAIRPVPKYFYFSEGTLLLSGDLMAGDELYTSGKLQIFDDNGLPIDPLAVANIFFEILKRFPILEAVGVLEEPSENPVSDYELDDIFALDGPGTKTMLFISKPDGQPYDNSENRLINISVVNEVNGLYSLDTSIGTSAVAIAGVTGDFTAEQRRLLAVGASTSGQLNDTFTLPTIPTPATGSAISLTRDFYSLTFIELEKYLIGEATFPTVEKLKIPPKIRTNETLNLLSTGNDILGAGQFSLTGAQESLAVAPEIVGDFSAPITPGIVQPNPNQWPNFPISGVTDLDDSSLPINLRDELNPTTQIFDDGDAATANLDIVLTLNNLPANSHVRVYNRKFLPDAVEARGDGAGGIVATNGTLSFLLKDPLGIRTPGRDESSLVIPESAVLIFDIIVVRRSIKDVARIYGNIRTSIDSGSSTTTNPVPIGTNLFGTANHRGISDAAILGLEGHTGGLSGDFVTVLKAITGEGNPRNASRFPTMSRRDLLIGGIFRDGTNTSFRGVLGAGRLSPDLHNSKARLGAPGGLGGRETQSIGIFSQNGQLAYDIVRATFRRTNNIVDRVVALRDNNLWTEPTALSPGGAGAGFFAGAVLQTISKYSETPEFGLLELLPESTLDDIPDNYNDFTTWIQGLATDSRVQTVIGQIITALENAGGLNTQNRDRVYRELYREIMVSIYGKRDAQWALANAIDTARDFIYIESPGFSDTQKKYIAGSEPDKPYFLDLMKKIKDRITDVPGLHVIICTPRKPDYAEAYLPFTAYESFRRYDIIKDDLPTDRVVAFHPVGFPGRLNNLESTTVIVDDVWAMIGSSSFRRRGLTFDGGSDLVFTDMQRINGKSPEIVKFRKALIADRLGMKLNDTNEFGTMPNASFVRLNSGVEAFYLIRETLKAGGLGKITRLYNAPKPTVLEDSSPEVDELIDWINPDGEEFNLAVALISDFFGSINSF